MPPIDLAVRSMTSSSIALPRLVVLDSAHLAGLVSDLSSASRERRHAANRFIPELIAHSWLPLLCWHHVEELLQHGDEQVVDARLRYLWSWPLLAWVRSADPAAGPGSIVDILGHEAAAALAAPEADVVRVRDLARSALIQVGTGLQAIPEAFSDWRMLRTALMEQQENARRITAISRWRASNIDDTRIGEWIGQPTREHSEAARTLHHLRGSLEDEISKRGDRRIVNAAGMADAFMADVVHDGLAVTAGKQPSPAIQLLINAGLAPEDIDPNATFRETMNLLTFHKRLHTVAEACGLPWPELKSKVKPNQLPVTVIEEGMRIYTHDQPERKGSELNDTHLLCLAPYADVTYVDRRTLESVRRVRSKVPVFEVLVGRVAKASNYGAIAKELAGL